MLKLATMFAVLALAAGSGLVWGSALYRRAMVVEAASAAVAPFPGYLDDPIRIDSLTLDGHRIDGWYCPHGPTCKVPTDWRR